MNSPFSGESHGGQRPKTRPTLDSNSQFKGRVLNSIDAVTGADISPENDGRPLQWGSPLRVGAGNVLTFGESTRRNALLRRHSRGIASCR